MTVYGEWEQTDIFDQLLDTPAWMAAAACKGMTEIMFPNRGEDSRDGRTICLTCPVREECLDAAIDNGEKYGVWGGLSETQRRRVRRDRNRNKPPVETCVNGHPKEHQSAVNGKCLICHVNNNRRYRGVA